MTKFKPGDRVHVEFDTTISRFHQPAHEENGDVLIDIGNGTSLAPLSAATLIPDPLPTAVNSVIRITMWRGEPKEWTALLTEGGWCPSWRGGTSIIYSAREFSEWAEWELLYVPNQQDTRGTTATIHAREV